MITTRICSFSNLNPELKSMFDRKIRPTDIIQHCVEGLTIESGGQLLFANILTQNSILYADILSGSGGMVIFKYFNEIENIEEVESASRQYHYVRISVKKTRDPIDSITVHFETPQQVTDYAYLLRRLTGQ